MIRRRAKLLNNKRTNTNGGKQKGKRTNWNQRFKVKADFLKKFLFREKKTKSLKQHDLYEFNACRCVNTPLSLVASVCVCVCLWDFLLFDLRVWSLFCACICGLVSSDQFDSRTNACVCAICVGAHLHVLVQIYFCVHFVVESKKEAKKNRNNRWAVICIFVA